MIAAGDLSIVLLRARDHRVFGALVDSHYVAVRRYLTRLVGDADVGAELAQETFLRAYLALPRLSHGSDVPAWLFRIATNLARQHYRRRQLIHWSPLLPSASSPSAVASRAAWSETPLASGRSLEDEVVRRDQVQHALAQLPLAQRSCLLLYAWAGYTCAEIGEMVGKSADAVRMLLVRARRGFRAAYEDLGWIDPESGESYAGSPAGMLPASGDGFSTLGRSGAETLAAGDAATMDEDHDLAGDLSGAVAPGESYPACPSIEEELSFFPRGDLPRAVFSALTRHLAQCGRCRRALTEVQDTYRALQRHLFLACADSAPDAPAAVTAHIRSAALLAVALPELDEAPVYVGAPRPRPFR
ncbi:MAG: hypothetical protein AVDCRST_MAG77-4070 [uncultured Chloroflexi bacterium]|uniref:RNA polymerase ECF-type sigma factor n=1 Tax=uncultured Chloroflexota bacterium TaxID=166587 RepID=A0A6J4JP30_9CHLR|nr:MAG: hypothetical protein AVDCRST_MAG77-4070 [uncultured Chloroflexota bacterium]